MSGGFHSCAVRAAIVIACLGGIAERAYAEPAIDRDTADARVIEAKKIFTTRCMACHTFGKGVKVGPDLKGINARRARVWLVPFIRGSAAVIARGDATAVALFDEFKQQRMPDWSDLSEAQVGNILDWLAVDGPEQQAPDDKRAELATAAEIEVGRQLFHGGRALASGGSACATCHSIGDDGASRGGTLAPELTRSYAVYQDVAMTLFLKRPCFARYPESESARFVTAEEAFAIKAYLRHAALTAQPVGLAMTKSVDNASPGGVRRGDAPAAGATSISPASPPTRVAWQPVMAEHAPRRYTHLGGELAFRVLPYLALAILIIGLIVRYAIARRAGAALDDDARDAWQRVRGARSWRAGIAVTLALHLLGVLAPRAVLGWNTAPLRLYMLEGAGLALGVLALLGWARLMWRHIERTAEDRETAHGGLTELADGALLSLIGLAIASGLAVALAYRWGSSWGATTLAPYLASLARGAPVTRLVEQLPFLVRVHVFTWFVALAVVPFTSVARLVAPAIDRVLMAAARPVTATVQLGRRIAARLAPARWIWPDDDDHPAIADSAHAHGQVAEHKHAQEHG